MPYLNGELPFSGTTPGARQNSYRAAEAQRSTRGTKKLKMLAYIRQHGRVTDQGLGEALGLPIQSICSLRNALCAEGLVTHVGHAMGRFNHRVSLWAAKETV
jgi:predicted transcriptional regulator